MRATRKDFIEGLRKEGVSISSDELKDLIKYYEELLDEQEIKEDDYVPEDYDYRKIINEFKLSDAYKGVKKEKKTSVKKSLSLIILSIISMPILLLLLIFVAPFLLIIPIGLFVFIIIAIGFLMTSFSLIWYFGTSSTFLFILGIILIIASCTYFCVYSLIAIIKFIAQKFYNIVMRNKFNTSKFKEYTSKKWIWRGELDEKDSFY